MSQLKQLLTPVMPTRHASIVESALNHIGIHWPHQLRGKHIPAHFSTDLRGVTDTTVSRLEKVLRDAGAVLVR